MDTDFTIEVAASKRYSVRNYSDAEVNTREIKDYIKTLSNPFGKKVIFHFLDKIKDGQKLGTYGVIKGAQRYIGVTTELEPYALEAVGYELEVLMLCLAYNDIGTCWLGGTFDKKAFANAMDISERKVFPVITPYGYPKEKMHLKESMMRKAIKADSRKNWDMLFFKGNFNVPLSEEDAEKYALALNMVRVGPSASNKQPWRIVFIDDVIHFFMYKEPGYSSKFPYDIQRIDMGICAAHFDLTVKEKGIKGSFVFDCDPKIPLPKNVEYVYSWKED